MSIQLPPLPYENTALEPFISKTTLEFHHGKHHQTYVNNLNGLLEGSDMVGDSLEEMIRKTAGVSGKESFFNNAAQVWNHTFYWNCMKPHGGGLPTGLIAEWIDRDFGDFSTFKDTFKKAALAQFGSGWAWLVREGDALKITKTSNADLPMAHGQKALLTVDVWEHAYYLDYQNRRPDYVETFMASLVNWDFVNVQLES